MSKTIYVLMDVETGDFFVPESYSTYSSKKRKRKIQAYVSRAVAEAAVKRFTPTPDPNKYVVVAFEESKRPVV